jgi:hypothetical protein
MEDGETLGLVSAQAGISLHASYGSLGISYQGSSNIFPTAFSPGAFGEGAVSWFDSFQLVARTPDAKVLPSTVLFGQAQLDGSLSDSQIAGFNSNSVKLSANFASQSYYNFDVPLVNSHLELRPVLSAVLNMDGSHRGYLSYGFGIDVSTKFGIDMISFGRTMKLTSLTFPDGSTPESLGYDIVFDSGMQSPNIELVPEPHALSLWTIGIAAALVVQNIKLRRRRVHAGHTG